MLKVLSYKLFQFFRDKPNQLSLMIAYTLASPFKTAYETYRIKSMKSEMVYTSMTGGETVEINMRRRL